MTGRKDFVLWYLRQFGVKRLRRDYHIISDQLISLSLLLHPPEAKNFPIGLSSNFPNFPTLFPTVVRNLCRLVIVRTHPTAGVCWWNFTLIQVASDILRTVFFLPHIDRIFFGRLKSSHIRNRVPKMYIWARIWRSTPYRWLRLRYSFWCALNLQCPSASRIIITFCEWEMAGGTRPWSTGSRRLVISANFLIISYLCDR